MLSVGRELKADYAQSPMPRKQTSVLYTTVLIGSLTGLAPVFPESARGSRSEPTLKKHRITRQS